MSNKRKEKDTTERGKTNLTTMKAVNLILTTMKGGLVCVFLFQLINRLINRLMRRHGRAVGLDSVGGRLKPNRRRENIERRRIK